VYLTAPDPGSRRVHAKEAVMKMEPRSLVQALVASLIPAIAWCGPVNVNTADASMLAKELDGIGPAKAQAIVEYRQKNGPFKSPDDLLKVDGIGERVLDMNRGNIQIGGGGTAAAKAKPAAKR
jgi:competence protein ComEA